MHRDQRVPIAIGLDAFVVVLFVAIGRRNHDEGSALGDVLRTAAPFLIGLAAAWLLVRAWRRPMKVTVGIALWPLTVLIGMLARRIAFDDGTATAFVVVATLFLGAFIVGWRAVWRLVDRRRQAQLSGGSLIAR